MPFRSLSQRLRGFLIAFIIIEKPICFLNILNERPHAIEPFRQQCFLIPVCALFVIRLFSHLGISRGAIFSIGLHGCVVKIFWLLTLRVSTRATRVHRCCVRAVAKSSGLWYSTAVVNCWHVTFLLVSCYELVIHSFGGCVGKLFKKQQEQYPLVLVLLRLACVSRRWWCAKDIIKIALLHSFILK